MSVAKYPLAENPDSKAILKGSVETTLVEEVLGSYTGVLEGQSVHGALEIKRSWSE